MELYLVKCINFFVSEGYFSTLLVALLLSHLK